MTEEEKANHDVIESAFYDHENGSGSKLNTLKHTKQITKNITMDDIKFTNKVEFGNKKG